MIFIDNNSGIVNNNSKRLQDIVLFKIPMGMRKNFLEIYGKFGHAPSKC